MTCIQEERDALERLNNEIHITTQHMNTVTDAINVLQQNKKDIKNKIEEEMNAIIQAAIDRQEQLIENLNHSAQLKSKQLTEQLTKLTAKHNELNQCYNKCEQLINRQIVLNKILSAATDLIRGNTKFTLDTSSDIDLYIDVNDITNMISNTGEIFDENSSSNKVKLSDVGGLETAKRYLISMIQYPLEYPEKFALFGQQKQIRGCFLWGPSGCGKTLLIKAIASEINHIKLISVTGGELLTNLDQNFIKNIFERAIKSEPCIVFFDQLEVITRARDQINSERIMNELIIAMDKISYDKYIWFIGSSSHHVFDASWIKHGRFEKLIFVNLPDFPSRVSVLKAVLYKSPIDPNIDFEYLAEQTNGYSSIDLCNIARDAINFAIHSAINSQIQSRRIYVEAELDPDMYEESDDEYPIITMDMIRISLKKYKCSVNQSEYQQFVLKKLRMDIECGVFDMEDKLIRELCVYGYVRKNTENMQQVPLEIIEWILKIYNGEQVNQKKKRKQTISNIG
eukprot:540251_1